MVVLDEDSTVVEANEAFAGLVGTTVADLVGTDESTLVVAEEPAEVLEWTSDGEPSLVVRARRYRHRSGRTVLTRCTIRIERASDGRPCGRYVHVADLTSPLGTDELLAHRATHDELTGLPNRTLLLDRLAQAMRRRERAGTEVVVLFVDLDGFKAVNDGLGHAAGDELLVEAASRLRRCVRPSDTVARLGGDEFVIVSEIDRPHHVAALCDRVLTTLARPVEIAGRALAVSGSVGVVIASDDQEPDDLLRDADVAMYRSKAEGRGRSTLFTASLRAEAATQLEQEARLRAAIDDGEIEVHYDAVVDARTGAVTGATAVVRWRHPSAGLLSPEDFPVAAPSGLATELGRIVLDDACENLARWQAEGHALRVGVDLDAHLLLDDRLLDTVVGTCRRAGADPAGLVLEVTENALTESMGVARARLRELRRLGVGVALDDFGTGYSSLQHLKDLPVDLVKVDRSFVQGLGAGDDGVLAEAVIRLADALGLHSMAQGVDRPEQLERLRATSCGSVEGTLFGRAVPASELDLAPRW